MNERIRISPIRVIDQNQNQLGVISLDEALALSREAGLDLVEVSPQERPPVCRIMDYGKHMYERKKRQKMAAQSHQVHVKEIRIRPKTDKHDKEIKVKHAKEFLDEGNKVQFTMLFRGRERFLRERAMDGFRDILAEFGDTVKVERAPTMEGRRMTMVIAPAKKQPAPKAPKPKMGLIETAEEKKASEEKRAAEAAATGDAAKPDAAEPASAPTESKPAEPSQQG